jgi:glycosyltransferase involved in cell wall biosynthesis
MEAPQGRFLYLVAEGLPPTVIESQVVAPLARLAERGLVFDLFIYQLQSPRPEWNVRERLHDIRRRLPGRVRLWPWPAQTKGVGAPARGEGSATKTEHARPSAVHPWLNKVALEGAYVALQALLLADVAPSMRRRAPVVVHARGAAAELALRLKRWYGGFRVVADIRGDAAAEYEYQMQLRGLSAQADEVRAALAALRDAETRFVRHADSVQCVSHALRRRLETMTGAAPGRIRVVPCLADERLFRFDAAARARRRRELGLEARTVLVYSGSLLAWQNGAAMLAMFRQLKDRLPSLHLLLLTPDRQAAAELLRGGGMDEGDSVTVRTARHEEVGGYLSAADVALLLRDPHPLNHVASPTKFAEYALCGLPVLASRGIGDLDEIIRSHGLGQTLESGDETAAAEPWIKKFVARPESPQDREGRAGRAAGILGLGSHIDSMIIEYRALSGQRPMD